MVGSIIIAMHVSLASFFFSRGVCLRPTVLFFSRLTRIYSSSVHDVVVYFWLFLKLTASFLTFCFEFFSFFFPALGQYAPVNQAPHGNTIFCFYHSWYSTALYRTALYRLEIQEPYRTISFRAFSTPVICHGTCYGICYGTC